MFILVKVNSLWRLHIMRDRFRLGGTAVYLRTSDTLKNTSKIPNLRRANGRCDRVGDQCGEILR